jgi:hypothetical protein
MEIMSRKRVLFSMVVASLLASVVAIGCNSRQGAAENRTEASAEDRLKVLAVLYCTGGPPANDEASFRKKVGMANPEMLKSFRLQSVDDLFISPRDQQPFVVRYGVPPGTPGLRGEILAYEAEGKDGKRFVALSSVDVKEMSDAEFKAALPK